MVQPDKQESIWEVKSRIVISKTLDMKKDTKPYAISTAKKSSIEARGLCAKCGVRVSRDDLESCSHCGSLICSDCKRLARKKANRLISAAPNG